SGAARKLGGLGLRFAVDLEAQERARVGEVCELGDDAAGDDVEVVVAVVLAFIRQVVVPDDDDVLARVLPEKTAGQLAQTVGLEVLRERGPRVRGDVLPLDRHQLCGGPPLLVQRLPSRVMPARPVIGTRAALTDHLAYSWRRYESPP